MMDLADLDAVACAQATRSGQVSAEEMVSAALARIAAQDPDIGAFVLTCPDQALAQARALDKARQGGSPCGPLHGVPVAIKDLFDLQGQPTRAGSRAIAPVAAQATAQSVARLQAAGAVVVGKTVTVEFAYGAWGTMPGGRAPINPRDRAVARVCGGSSSGSAAAVAAGMVPLALGTDTGGSVRNPASLCGIWGLKSTVGLIGRGGVFALSGSHDSVGPMARSARDIALATALMAGPDPQDAATLDPAAPPPAVQAAPLFVLNDPALALMTPEAAAAWSTFLTLLAERGIRPAPLSLPATMHELAIEAGRIMSFESHALLHHLTEDPASAVADPIRARINHGRSIDAASHAATLARKTRWSAQMAQALAGGGLLLAPTLPCTAIALSEVDETDLRLSIFGRHVNMLGLCAVSAPLMRCASGLPLGVQVIGPAFAEDAVLQMAARLAGETL